MSQGQPVNVSDLDVAQLSDVRKQLEEVSEEMLQPRHLLKRSKLEPYLGIKSPHELIRPAQASTGKV